MNARQRRAAKRIAIRNAEQTIGRALTPSEVTSVVNGWTRNVIHGHRLKPATLHKARRT